MSWCEQNDESLLPCPFCGENGELQHHDRRLWTARCANITGCGVILDDMFASAEETRAVWNRRVWTGSDVFASARSYRCIEGWAAGGGGVWAFREWYLDRIGTEKTERAALLLYDSRKNTDEDYAASLHRSFADTLSAMQEEHARLRGERDKFRDVLAEFSGAIECLVTNGRADNDKWKPAMNRLTAAREAARRALSIQDSPEGQEGK